VAAIFRHFQVDFGHSGFSNLMYSCGPWVGRPDLHIATNAHPTPDLQFTEN
jgi:hypothetical protein